MTPQQQPEIDAREPHEILEEILRRRPGYAPGWALSEYGPDGAVAQIAARYLHAIVKRLNYVPEKSKLAFLDLLGMKLIPAQAARAIVVFQLAEQAADGAAPAGTQVGAAPADGSEQIIYETQRRLGLMAARIREVVSLWPGRDQYINHSSEFLAGRPIRPFDKSQLVDTPHHLYLAHETLLALSGTVHLQLEFELSRPGREPLDILWEFWDGQTWRGFLSQRRDCREADEPHLDGTLGLTRSGKVHLLADCAAAVRTAVNGIESFWLRGRLDEPLPIDPNQVLPEITQVRLSTLIERDLPVTVHAIDETYGDSGSDFILELRDTNGKPITDARVELVEARAEVRDDGQMSFVSAGRPQALRPADDQSRYVGEIPGSRESAGGTLLTIRHHARELTVPFRYRPLSGKSSLTMKATLQIGGLQPEAALSDGVPVDLSKPFFPLGQVPQPGAAFYFACEEAFSKAGARVLVHLQRTTTPQDELHKEEEAVEGGGSDGGGPIVLSSGPGNAFRSESRRPISHQINWEYWNGRDWAVLRSFEGTSVATDGTAEHRERAAGEFAGSGAVALQVPEDMEVVAVNGEEALWMRARLVSGSYGFRQIVHIGEAPEPHVEGALPTTRERVEYIVYQPPALSDLRLSYVWNHGAYHAESVLAYNDFRFTDYTDDARWPGTSFSPYRHLADVNPTLYVGFDKRLPVDNVSLYFGIDEPATPAQCPALVWESFDGFNWRRLPLEDETDDLGTAGVVSFVGPSDMRPLPRFDAALYWVRARLKEDGPPCTPLIAALHPNAAWVSQWQTIVNQALGASDGQANQVLSFPQHPVLEGEQIEIRELSGARANVEWRILARDLLGADHRVILDLQSRLGREDGPADIEQGDLRLRRDRNKRVVEAWVRWKSRAHLLDSGANDRHYVLERAEGSLLFGDGRHGKIPPLGAAIQARLFRTGGGAAGNVAAGAINQLLGGLSGVEATFNPRPAEGGADGETLDALSRRGPATLRRRGRAVLPTDFEVMAREASPAVAVVRALPARDWHGQRRPGWITLVIIPRSDAPRPWPSRGLREHVRRRIEPFASAGLSPMRRLCITGPDYWEVGVDVTVWPRDPAAAGLTEQAVRSAIGRFLHPISGGPEGNGWEPGRNVYASDIASVLERVDEVDYVRELTLLVEGVPQGESVRVPDGRFVAAGDVRIRIEM